MTERIEELRQSIAELEHQASTRRRGTSARRAGDCGSHRPPGRARQQADALAAELSDLNRHAAEVRDSRGGFEVQRAEAQARLTFVRENCAAELNQSLEELAREQSIDEEFDLGRGPGPR